MGRPEAMKTPGTLTVGFYVGELGSACSAAFCDAEGELHRLDTKTVQAGRWAALGEQLATLPTEGARRLLLLSNWSAVLDLGSAAPFDAAYFETMRQPNERFILAGISFRALAVDDHVIGIARGIYASFEESSAVGRRAETNSGRSRSPGLRVVSSAHG